MAINEQGSLNNLIFSEKTQNVDTEMKLLTETTGKKVRFNVNNHSNKDMVSSSYIPTKFDDAIKNKVLIKRKGSKTSCHTDIAKKIDGKKIELQISFLEKFKDCETFAERAKDSEKNSTDSILITKGGNTKIAKKTKSRVFWEKDKIQLFRARFKMAKDKILRKTDEDFRLLKENVNNKETEKVLKTLLDQDFQRFYKINLKKSDILAYILKKNEMDLLAKILEDKFYHFNKQHIYTILIRILKDGEIEEIDQEDIIEIKNIINYKLFHEQDASIIIYYMGLFKLYDCFRILIPLVSELKDQAELFEDKFKIDEYIEDAKRMYDNLNLCLEKKYEDLAEYLYFLIRATVKFFMVYSDDTVTITAINNSCLKFLQSVWELSFDEKKRLVSNHKTKFRTFSPSFNHSHTVFSDNHLKNSLFGHFAGYNPNFNNGLAPFKISLLIEKFAKNKNNEAIKYIITWNNLESDHEFLQKLFDYNCFDEISILIYSAKRLKWPITKEMFRSIIINDELDLLLFFLKIQECRLILEHPDIQKFIVEKYMRYGHKLYYGAEMLSYIYKVSWNNELTKQLCKNILYCIKKREIVNCHSPILTCLLLAEFLSVISSVSVTNTTRCLKTVHEVIELSKHIQQANSDEDYIRFIMTQKDTRKRTALLIASENNFLEVLQNPEIGTIVGKMWNGRINHNGFLSASSLCRYLDTELKSLDPFLNFDPLDTSKNYFYQFDVWTDSSSLRFWPESISTIFLILIFNLFIWSLADRQIITMHYSKYSETGNGDLLNLLYIYTFWIIMIVLNIINQYMFVFSTKRKFRLDYWQIIDIITLGFVFSLYFDINKIFGSDPDNPLEIAFLSRAGLLCANNVLVWMRISGILLSFKEVGPMISLIYEMLIHLSKYLILYSLWIMCSAAIMTIIFFRYSPMCSEFSTTIFYLIGGFISNFDARRFSNFILLGECIFMMYVVVSGILLINLLIASLTSVYEETMGKVDASHRSVLIQYYKRYKWEPNYGYLIFLTTPLNILNYIVYPISFFFKGGKRLIFNQYVVNFYYLFYFSLILLFFSAITLVVIPLCYIKGLILYIGRQAELKIEALIKVLNILKWIFLGIPFLLYIFVRDLYYIITSVFKKIHIGENSMGRIRKYLTPEDVIVFLEFIHSKNNNSNTDLHVIFNEYIIFEQNIKMQQNARLKENLKYLRRMKTKDGKLNANLFIYNTKINQNYDNSYTGRYMKKNLIIIETLENFVTDETHKDSSVKKVDIEKLKMLLPKTKNVDNSYMNRLIYTDICSLNKALNKLKYKRDYFLQFTNMNKIVTKAIKLDKEIDKEVMKFYRRKQVELAIKRENYIDELEEYSFVEQFHNLLNRMKNSVEENALSVKPTDYDMA